MTKFGINDVLGVEAALFVHETINGDYSGPYVSDLFIDGSRFIDSASSVLWHINSETSLIGISHTVDVVLEKLIHQIIGFNQKVIVTGYFSWNIDQSFSNTQVTVLGLDVSETDSGSSGFGQTVRINVVKVLSVTNALATSQTVSSFKGYVRSSTGLLGINSHVLSNAGVALLNDIRGFEQIVVVERVTPDNQYLTIRQTVSPAGSTYKRTSTRASAYRQVVRVIIYKRRSNGSIVIVTPIGQNSDPRYSNNG